MPTRVYPKVLLVEGRKDKRVIPELIEKNGIAWGESADKAIVFILEFGGLSNLLRPGVIELELKASQREMVGVMIDADDDALGRFQSIRNRCLAQFPSLPMEPPSEGLIASNADGLKLGIWLMPDNKSRGALENFLMFLAPDATDSVVRYAKRATKRAKRLGATYNVVDESKALIYTWLAWQDEPGRQLHEAVKENIFRSQSTVCHSFVSWFRKLFEV